MNCPCCGGEMKILTTRWFNCVWCDFWIAVDKDLAMVLGEKNIYWKDRFMERKEFERLLKLQAFE